MLKVGVTGGIGSGKSTVCHLFQCLEIPIFNADEAGRQLLAKDNDVIGQVQNLLGEDTYVEGKPDRKKIAEIVFVSPEKLQQLNSIIHPAVRNKFLQWTLEQSSPYLIYEAAILFETGLYKQLDFTILITAPESLRINRVIQRDKIEESSVKNRMKNQWSDEDKKKLADFIIANDDTTPLLPRVMELHHMLISKAK
jgi:dephospho-CoA kinase